jgi:cell division protein FtsB
VSVQQRPPIWLSIGFWLCLFCGLGLFAAAFLAPRLVARDRLSQELVASSQRLQEAEQRYRQMQRTIEALRTDPEFASELARVQLDAVRSGEEVLRVPAGMGLQLTDSLPAQQIVPAEGVAGGLASSPVTQFAKYLDSRPRLRWTMLGLSGALVLLGFGFCVPRPISVPPIAEKAGPEELGS